MTMRGMAIVACLLVSGRAALAAQTDSLVRSAQDSYVAGDFPATVHDCLAALARPQLGTADRVSAFELLAYSYGAMDSTRLAVEAFKELAFLDPDREPDVVRVSPRIISLYASALGQVLIVRHLAVDSGSFVAGAGSVSIAFELTRAARFSVRVVGDSTAVLVDSQVTTGAVRTAWNGLGPAGHPLAPGLYRIVVAAAEGRNEFTHTVQVRVTHGALDTLPHLLSLPGYDVLPEKEPPPRDWRSFGIVALYAGAAMASTLALESKSPSYQRRELLGVSVTMLATGVTLSLRTPAPAPVEANIRYNRIVREQLEQRNAAIARENEQRRAQVVLGIHPIRPSPP